VGVANFFLRVGVAKFFLGKWAWQTFFWVGVANFFLGQSIGIDIFAVCGRLSERGKFFFGSIRFGGLVGV